MGLLDRIGDARRQEQRFSIDTWLTDYLLPSLGQFGYGGHNYLFGGLNQTLAGQRVQEVASTLPAYAAALRGSPPAFAAQMVRALVLSQARLTFRNPPSHTRTPRRLFGTSELAILERPWPGATTAELLSRMEWHAGLAGNAFAHRRSDRLRVLRPDYTGILYGSEREPDDPMHAIDGELLGYVYKNGGLASNYDPVPLDVDSVAHWSPIPDPESPGLGQSWITPALRDIQGDKAATEHKVKFFVNGATPNLVVNGIPAMTKTQFDEIVDAMESKHAGVANAYRTLYLTAGADAKVVGSDLKQIDFKSTQGAGETRISVLSRVPAPLLGIAEGLAGSSLNAGNFGQARRLFADTWVFPILQDLCASLSRILNLPRDGELWFDSTDMPLLREDAKDAAEIQQINAISYRQYIDAGMDPDAAARQLGLDGLVGQHTGMFSVQLQPPMPDGPATPPSEGTE